MQCKKGQYSEVTGIQAASSAFEHVSTSTAQNKLWQAHPGLAGRPPDLHGVEHGFKSHACLEVNQLVLLVVACLMLAEKSPALVYHDV